MYCEMGYRLAAEKIVDNAGLKKRQLEHGCDSEANGNAEAKADESAQAAKGE